MLSSALVALPKQMGLTPLLVALSRLKEAVMADGILLPLADPADLAAEDLALEEHLRADQGLQGKAMGEGLAI
jgi:hypothetical protein